MNCLNKIRKPEYIADSKKIQYSLFIFLFGIVLGIISKALDETASNQLPSFIESLDLCNFFSRIGIWMFIGICISFYSKTSFRGAINNLLFFIGMVGSYYFYTIKIAGFFPKSYMLFWIVMTLISPFFGMVCWYAKGTHKISILISAVIFLFMTRQTFHLGFWYFDIQDQLEFVLWIATIFILFETPKQIVMVVSLGTLLFIVTSPFHLFLGIL